MAIGTELTKESGIYKITIGSRFYYGSAKNIKQRCASHISDMKKGTHANRMIQASYNKYKYALFEVIEICHDVISNPSSLLRSEQRWIDFGYSSDNCMNICPTAGNSMGVKHTKESRLNMSKAHIGLRTGASHPRFGKGCSDEQREKCSKANMGKIFNESHKRNHLIGCGKKENRERISNAHKGRIQSKEWIEKRMVKQRGASSQFAKKIWLSHPHNGMMKFDLINDACESLGIQRTTLSRWLNGSRPFPGDGKYKNWKTNHLIGLKGGFI